MKSTQWLVAASVVAAVTLVLASGVAASPPQALSFTSILKSNKVLSVRTDGPNTVFEFDQTRLLAGDISGTAEETIRLNVQADGTATFQGYLRRIRRSPRVGLERSFSVLREQATAPPAPSMGM
jgi:hypothetical protein